MALWQQGVQDVGMFLLPAARPTTERPSTGVALMHPPQMMPAYQFYLTLAARGSIVEAWETA